MAQFDYTGAELSSDLEVFSVGKLDRTIMTHILDFSITKSLSFVSK